MDLTILYIYLTIAAIYGVVGYVVADRRGYTIIPWKFALSVLFWAGPVFGALVAWIAGDFDKNE